MRTNKFLLLFLWCNMHFLDWLQIWQSYQSEERQLSKAYRHHSLQKCIQRTNSTKSTSALAIILRCNLCIAENLDPVCFKKKINTFNKLPSFRNNLSKLYQKTVLQNHQFVYPKIKHFKIITSIINAKWIKKNSSNKLCMDL